jgi:hypothetical protein
VQVENWGVESGKVARAIEKGSERALFWPLDFYKC